MSEFSFDEIKDRVFDILKTQAKDLWESGEDADFLKEVGLDIAKLRFNRLMADTDEKKAALERELQFTQEALAQRIQAKRNLLTPKGHEIFSQLVSILIDVAIKFI